MRLLRWTFICLALLCSGINAWAQRLHLAGLQAVPKKLTLKWDASPQGPFGPPSQDPSNPLTPTTIEVARTWSALHRSPGSSGTPAAFPLSFGTNTQYEDSDWQLNTLYEYWLTGSIITYSKAYNSQGGYWYWSGPGSTPHTYSKIYVEIKAKAVSAVATADSRLDMRFATEQLLDYTFNAVPASNPPAPTFYRGGLFAGYQQDGSRVGRSYLRFNNLVTTPDPNLKIWPVGGLQIFVPRLAKTGSVTLTTRKLSDETFSPSSLVWSNAPSLGASVANSGTINWNATSPTRQWISINTTPEVQDAVKTDGNLALSLQSANEGTAGWAYIARPGYIDSTYTLPLSSLTPPDGLAPFLIYAIGGDGAELGALSVTPNTVTSGASTTVTGTVSTGAIAPTGGMLVSLASNNSAASVPSTVTIPAGQSSASFTVTWSSVTTTTVATITAMMGNVKTATLTINPGSGGGGGGTGTLSTLSISPGGVSAGTSATGTITLSSAAPTGGIAVNLSSNNTSAAQVPASVTVPAGQTSTTFTITTGPGYAYYSPATITATSSNTKTASLYVYPGGGGGGGGPIGGDL